MTEESDGSDILGKFTPWNLNGNLPTNLYKELALNGVDDVSGQISIIPKPE